MNAAICRLLVGLALAEERNGRTHGPPAQIARCTLPDCATAIAAIED